MSAWLELHSVLSLKVDAKEAYRLMHAYRDEELRKHSERSASTVEAYDGELAMLRELVRTLRVVVRPDDTEVDVAEVRRLLHHHAADDAEAREKSSRPAADATPDFFQAGHTYTREHHGDTIQFLVEHVSTSPDGSHRAAHGWRTRSWDPGWEPADSDDRTGWTDVTEAVAP